MPVVPTTLARDADHAAAAARAIGGRVVLKIASDDIAHKSDIGGVVLNLEGDAAVAEAFRRIMAAAPAGARVDGVLVAPMRSGGLELFVGCTRDRAMGSGDRGRTGRRLGGGAAGRGACARCRSTPPR